MGLYVTLGFIQANDHVDVGCTTGERPTYFAIKFIVVVYNTISPPHKNGDTNPRKMHFFKKNFLQIHGSQSDKIKMELPQGFPQEHLDRILPNESSLATLSSLP